MGIELALVGGFAEQEALTSRINKAWIRRPQSTEPSSCSGNPLNIINSHPIFKHGHCQKRKVFQDRSIHTSE